MSEDYWDKEEDRVENRMYRKYKQELSYHPDPRDPYYPEWYEESNDEEE